MADSSDPPTTMKITVKTPKEQHTIEIPSNATVQELRASVSEQFSQPPELLCLIFSGKIMKDDETLVQHKLSDGFVVHLVIKSAAAASRNSQNSSTSTSTSGTTGTASQPPNNSSQPPTSNPLAAGGGANPFAAFLGGAGGGGLGGAGLGGLGEMQQQMMQNPEMMRQLMDSPFVQGIMSNPDIIRGMLNANPQIQQLLERNPELNHVLNNPEVLRQSMELARNPAAFNELMRSQDRALSNLESLPGGYNALQRMYRDIQEPMLNAVQDRLVGNPFAGLVQNEAAANPQQGVENREPLPNPWASAPIPPPVNRPTSTTSPGPDDSAENTRASTGNGTNAPAGTGMAALMQQMMQNMGGMQNLLNTPYTQAVLDSLLGNPDLANQMMSANPLFANNPALQEQLRSMTPNLINQLRDPEFQLVLANPAALQAIMQIQQGIEQLRVVAPGFANRLGFGNLIAPLIPAETAAAASLVRPPPAPSPGESTTVTSSSGGTDNNNATGGNAPNPFAGFAGLNLNQDTINEFMSTMVSSLARQNNASSEQQQQPPLERFRSQIDQLRGMGFVHNDAVLIEVLQATGGNVEMSIEILLQRNS